MNLEKTVIKYKNGDQSQFNIIYNETIKLVHFAIYRYVQAKETIEDLSQDTYMRFDKQIKDYNPSNVRSYIYTIAKNIAIDYVRKKRELLLDDEYCACDKEKNPYLHYALNHIDEDLKEVFLMKVLCGHTNKRIAEILNISPSLVNRMYHQAKKELKESLEANYEI